jgi:UDP-glucose 4-epimerase
MVKILVTGGSGFIGSYLVERLKDSNFVRVLDLSKGKVNGVEYITGSISSDEIIKKALENIDIVYHLAAQTSVPYSFENPDVDAETNILGTIKLLKYCKKIKKFVYVSTSSVYGPPRTPIVDEKHLTDPTSPYGLSKLCAEKYCELFSKINNFELAIIRLSSPYGLGARGVISIFFERAIKNEDLNIYGDGESRRTYIYIDDVVNALTKFIEKGVGVFNITHIKDISLNELAEKIIRLTNSKSKIVHLAPTGKEEIIPPLNIDKAKKELDWSPSISIDEGLKRMWKKIRGE